MGETFRITELARGLIFVQPVTGFHVASVHSMWELSAMLEPLPLTILVENLLHDLVAVGSGDAKNR